jgi:hypothetical protein
MLRTCGLVIAVALLMVACGGGGGGGGGNSAPLDLQYAVATGQVGSPLGPYPPSVSGTVTGYSVSPALPAGLTLDPTSGVISGTPVAASSGTYTVTASNGAGTATAALTLVIHGPPSGLTYTSPVTGTVGAALTPLVPTLSGDADGFSVYPPLPAGLMLDPATGIVSGTPTSARLPLVYTVSASSSVYGGDAANFQLLLTVDPPPAGTAVTGVFRSDTVIGLGYVSGTHSGVTDASGAFTYEQGQGITFFVGAVSIGGIPTAKNFLTPVDLVVQGTGASNRVLNVVRFLMMLDQDGNVNNGIQVSAAVTAAAASWVPVDFDTTDLPTALGPIIQQASAADGVSHVLPDAATAQAHLRAAFYCTHSGTYFGTFGANSPSGRRGAFVASVFPDGSMDSIAYAAGTTAGFELQTNDAVSPLLDATFTQSDESNNWSLQGSFADATYLSGTYTADAAGKFQAGGDASVTATYKFTGSYTNTPKDLTTSSPYTEPASLYMDDLNRVSATVPGSLTGTVSGNTFTGTVQLRLEYYDDLTTFPVSGTYSNTAAGVTLDGQYTTNDSIVTFSMVGCRAN